MADYQRCAHMRLQATLTIPQYHVCLFYPTHSVSCLSTPSRTIPHCVSPLYPCFSTLSHLTTVYSASSHTIPYHISLSHPTPVYAVSVHTIPHHGSLSRPIPVHSASSHTIPLHISPLYSTSFQCTPPHPRLYHPIA